MITIDGLTLEQVRMLDHMWAIDSYEDLLEWQQSLSCEERQMSETLAELVTLAEIDELVLTQETYIDADNLISKIKKAIKQ
jgi:ribosome-associated toxin RatA of RatAB toxin-antitoxin module